MRRNLKITLSYDGSEFRGWQIQPGLPTVQGILADCLGRITGENVLPQGSGRTDAGVHALAQVASVAIESPILEQFDGEIEFVVAQAIQLSQGVLALFRQS